MHPSQNSHSVPRTPLTARQRAGIDGFLPPARPVRRPVLNERPPAIPPRPLHQISQKTSFTQTTTRAFAVPTTQTPQKEKKWRYRLKDAATIIIAIILGFAVQSVVLGQVVLLIYAICAFVFRIESRTTFLLAILSLGVVLVSSARTNQSLASIFGIYAFLLLAIGTITLGREVRNEL